jgi:hypothetical protein
MSKKIILFGTAFGSLAAASMFVYFSKELYLSDSSFGQGFFPIMLILSTIVGVVLCITSINRDSENTAVLPALIFSGIITGIIICLIVSVLHSFLLSVHPELIENYVAFKQEGHKAACELINLKEPDLKKHIDIAKELNAFKEKFTSRLLFFFIQFSTVVPFALLSSAITGYILIKRRA